MDSCLLQVCLCQSEWNRPGRNLNSAQQLLFLHWYNHYAICTFLPLLLSALKNQPHVNKVSFGVIMQLKLPQENNFLTSLLVYLHLENKIMDPRRNILIHNNWLTRINLFIRIYLLIYQNQHTLYFCLRKI